MSPSLFEIFLSKSLEEKKTFPKLLFLKGNSYKYELLELCKTKKIIYQEYPSLTDKYSKILCINSVDKLDVKNEK